MRNFQIAYGVTLWAQLAIGDKTIINFKVFKYLTRTSTCSFYIPQSKSNYVKKRANEMLNTNHRQLRFHFSGLKFLFMKYFIILCFVLHNFY